MFFGYPIFSAILLIKKTILWLVKKTTKKLDMFKSICLIWLSGQIDQMLKWLVFGLVFQSIKPWCVIMNYLIYATLRYARLLPTKIIFKYFRLFHHRLFIYKC
jgi:hypothetical protein